MIHPHLANREDACLVVIDMQEPFLRVMFDRETVVENTRKLVETARVLGLPVLVTVQNPERMGDTVPAVAEVLPPGESVSKMSFSCCREANFADSLATLGRRTVILCGVETHICVNQTAHDLLARGYSVHVPEDAVCSRTERNWHAGIEKMRQSDIVISSTEMVMYELLGCAGTPEFKQMLKLVK